MARAARSGVGLAPIGVESLMRNVEWKRLSRVCSFLTIALTFSASLSGTARASVDITVQDADTGYAILKDAAGFHATSGERLKFTAAGLSTPSWSFGDGSGSQDVAPVHAYSSATDAQFVVSVS